MSKFRHFLALTAVLLASASFASAQETQTKVIDEVVAVVNDGVITLSRIKREMKEAVDSFVQQGKTKAEAEKMVAEKQGELIANMINEELMIQKAKEAGLERDIEDAILRRLKEIMDGNGIKTVEELYKEMEKQGVSPDELKDNWRRQATRDQVIQREVQSKLYWGANGKEVKDYFEKNRSKFATPEKISFSELYLAYAGRDEAAVKEKAKQLSAQLRSGADFDKLVKENGDKALVTDGKGKAEKLITKDLNEVIGKPLTGVPVGGYTAPIEIEQLGVAILRVDAREEASSNASFDEQAVRMALMQEKFPAEQKKFMAKLREDSYIKINETYKPIVNPLLYEDERKAKAPTK